MLKIKKRPNNKLEIKMNFSMTMNLEKKMF